MSSTQENILIVEGQDDLHAIYRLVSAHVVWPAEQVRWPVTIVSENGAKEILRRGNLVARFRAENLKRLGVVLDCDTDPLGTYRSLRNNLISDIPALPDQLPENGLIISEGLKRFGLWMMPDNVQHGTLEVFLKSLIPETLAMLWQHAVKATSTAKDIGASFHEAHRAKAELYTWLAWQDKPGQKPGQAILQGHLNASAPDALAFVSWFKTLYQL